MAIKAVLAKAHKGFADNPAVKEELSEIQKSLDRGDYNFQENTVNFIFAYGRYKNDDKKMDTICVFVNKTGKTINELHGVIDIDFKEGDAIIAQTTLNFDEPFLGELNNDEALLVHFNIPVVGLNENKNFTIKDIKGSFNDVRVTYKGEAKGTLN